MERRDYILREIEKMGILLQALMGRLIKKEDIAQIQENFYPDFIAELNDEGFDFTQFLSAPKELFPTIFTVQNGFNAENIEGFADFLTLLSNNSRPEMQLLLRKKALEVYQYVNEVSKTFSMERESKIDKLR